jgi:hypothetical protein
MLQVTLERDGFEVIAVAGVVDALSRVAEEKVDRLLSDDMRHTHPQASNAGAQWHPRRKNLDCSFVNREPRCEVL